VNTGISADFSDYTRHTSPDSTGGSMEQLGPVPEKSRASVDKVPQRQVKIQVIPAEIASPESESDSAFWVNNSQLVQALELLAGARVAESSIARILETNPHVATILVSYPPIKGRVSKARLSLHTLFALLTSPFNKDTKLETLRSRALKVFQNPQTFGDYHAICHRRAKVYTGGPISSMAIKRKVYEVEEYRTQTTKLLKEFLLGTFGTKLAARSRNYAYAKAILAEYEKDIGEFAQSVTSILQEMLINSEAAAKSST
jgi:hypothetical protein